MASTRWLRISAHLCCLVGECREPSNLDTCTSTQNAHVSPCNVTGLASSAVRSIQLVNMYIQRHTIHVYARIQVQICSTLSTQYSYIGMVKIMDISRLLAGMEVQMDGKDMPACNVIKQPK